VRVDIYWWTDQKRPYQQYLCGLIAKACAGGYRVLVLTPGQQEASELDKLLWSIPATKFVPHQCTHVENPEKVLSLPAGHYSVPVLIIDAFVACEPPPPADSCLLINTCATPYKRDDHIGRVAEFLQGAHRDKPEIQTKIAYYDSHATSLQLHELT
jgi:DNA polymerase IIIc chi subunit